jgi:hypothetical protein
MNGRLMLRKTTAPKPVLPRFPWWRPFVTGEDWRYDRAMTKTNERLRELEKQIDEMQHDLLMVVANVDGLANAVATLVAMHRDFMQESDPCRLN